MEDARPPGAGCQAGRRQRGKGGPAGGLADELRGDAAVATEVEKKVKRPQPYKVLLHNDDYTTMDFVVMVLVDVFHHQEDEAVRIMLEVHQLGIGVAGVYSYEIAETKIRQVTEMARRNGYPLRCSMEPA